MSNPNYTLEIISRHPKFNSRSLRKYYVDGIETVGVWGDEPFEIRFKNNTWQKVQIKLTLDGTDILTGKPADTEVSKDMWVVNGYATISLKAWPETNNGGASFVFTSANNSVAVHTHGDLSSRGIIAAAVFTEGHVETIKINPPIEHHHHHHDHWPDYIQPIWTCTNGTNTAGGDTSDYFYMSEVSDGAASASLESLVSVGAGEHVDQKITYVSGLIKPVFTETVRVKYLWWDDLQEKLRTQTKARPQPSGFPGDHGRKNIDLGGTPRIGEKKGSFRRLDQQPVVYDRF